jgi:hypothetical protein
MDLFLIFWILLQCPCRSIRIRAGTSYLLHGLPFVTFPIRNRERLLLPLGGGKVSSHLRLLSNCLHFRRVINGLWR